MPYIGRGPELGVRSRFIYTATANQTSFSGNDDAGISLAYTDTLYMDVYQNGVLLVPATDYAASTGTSVVLVQGASVGDTLELLVHDIFSVADSVSAKDGGSFAGNVGMGGTLSVTGNTTVGGTLGVTGAVTLSTKLATTNLATGAVVQVVNTTSVALATGTTLIPLDDTIPQNDEGTEFLTLAITPTNASNKLKIDVGGHWTAGTASRWIIMGLFQDSTAGAIAANADFETTAAGIVTHGLTHFMTAGTTSETTFKVRVGANASATISMNGQGEARTFGGVMGSSITITEIAV